MANPMPDTFAHSVIESGWHLTRPDTAIKLQTEQVETDHGSVRLGIAVADERLETPQGAYGPTYLFAFGFDAITTETYHTQPWQAAAKELNARFIMVDTPGFGEESAPLPKNMYPKLLRGDFRGSARLMLQAVKQAKLLEEGEEINLMGYSMGTLTVSAMAELLQNPNCDNHIPRVKIAGTYLVDPTSPRLVNKLLSDILNDRHDGAGYYRSFNSDYAWLVANPEVTKPDQLHRLQKRQMGARAVYGFAIASANSAKMLTDAIKVDRHDHTTGISEATIRTVRGTRSRISLHGATEQALTVVRRELHPAGRADHIPLNGESHFWPHAAVLTGAAALYLHD